MAERPKKQPNWPLLMPIGLLLLEIIVFAVMRLVNFEITQYLFYFFILLGLFLIYQIAKQLITLWRVKSAVKQLEATNQLAESGQAMAAIKQWKKLLMSLPRDKYLEVLALIEATYQKEDMPKAVQQVRLVHSESIEFFELAASTQRATAKDRQEWQNQAYELRNMIKALPESKI